MKSFYWTILCFSTLFIASCNNTSFQTVNLGIEINQDGYICSISNLASNSELLPDGEKAPIIQIRKDNKFLLPTSFNQDQESNNYIVGFQNSEIQAIVKIENKNTHLRLELINLINPDGIDVLVWGPYPTTINQTVGETVGVVRDAVFAFGIQSMNLKTLGGFPYEESDIDRAYDIFESNDLVDIADSLKVLYRGHTAEKKEFGSVIQAYCRNRNQDRIIPNWNHDFYLAPAYDDGGLIGSAIAIFGCPAEEALNNISEIELKENLPHPILDGQWGKTANSATASYLIMNFGEKTLDIAIDLTKEAGLNYLYHGGPFINWGHFELNKTEFPDNWESMKKCVDRARDKNIRLGLHTLSNFITTNDPYVSPVPDPRLAVVGSSILVNDISATNKNIQIADPKFFNQMKNNTLHAVKIENEIIRYKKVSDSEPWTLLDCERGAFGTATNTHKAKTTISKLMDHGYKTFLSNIELSKEIALTIADLYNKTGLRQISFDGLEGNWSTGLGQYGRQLFTQTWYDSLDPENQGEIITDASNPGHFFWHMYTRMNWGEPWYAGFRESQTQYRLLNQSYYRRNLMPSMLGWFRMTPEISMEDIEWLLARAAGFDAGFALVTSPDIVDSHGMGKEILAKIKLWEAARMAEAFPEKRKKEMEDISNEYHLEATGPNSWNLFKASLVKGDYLNKDLQPGEPRLLNLELNNPNPEQTMQFVLSNTKDGTVENITLDIDGFKKVLLPLNIPPEHHIKYSGGSYIRLYDKTWHLINKARVVQSQLMLDQGEHKIQFEASFNKGSKESSVHVEFRTLSLPENLRSEK